MSSVFLGFIHPNTVTAGFMESVLQVIALSQQDQKIKAVQMERGFAGSLGECRNRVTEKFLKSDCDHLWFVDTDIIFKPGALDRLLSHDKDIVSGRYDLVMENPNWDWHTRACAFKWADETRLRGLVPLKPPEDNGLPNDPRRLAKVGACGAGFILIKRHALEAIKRNWWGEWNSEMGEDVSFCKRAAEAGFDIWFDWDLKVLHQKTVWV
jgi:GT2 family glycosyltransferase